VVASLVYISSLATQKHVVWTRWADKRQKSV